MTTPQDSADDLATLLRGRVARDVLRSLMRDQTVRQRNGLPVESWCEPVLRALAAAAEIPPPATVSAIGHPLGRFSDAGVGLVSTGEAAGLAGCHERTVRRLVASGRVIGERVGRSWRVDMDSLRRVRERTAHHDHTGS